MTRTHTTALTLKAPDRGSSKVCGVQALAEEASTRQSPAAREAEVLLLLRGLIALVEVDPRSQVRRCPAVLRGANTGCAHTWG